MDFVYRHIDDDDEQSYPRWLPYLVFAVLTAIVAYPILRDVHNWGVRDWDLFTTLHASAVRSVLEYGQFPFWNPYIGGGNILFAHPEVPVLNPLFALQLTFGPLIGLKLQIVICYYLGFIGSYLLARRLGIEYRAAFIPPVVYMLSSYFALHFAAGHIPFHYFAALPWLVFFYKKSLERPVHILSVGAVTGLMILGSGAAVPLLLSLFFLLLVSLFDIGAEQRFRPPLWAVAGGTCGVLFAAVKFFPMLDYLGRNPWVPDGTVMVTPVMLLPKMLFLTDQSLFSDYAQGYVWGWHEYGAFIGPIVGLLVLGALVFRFHTEWRYLALACISLVLVLGSFLPPWSPWDLLHRLPGFESIRVPSRFILLAVFAFAILAGKGMEVFLAFFRYRRIAFPVLIFVAVTGTHLLVSLPILNEAFTRTPEQVTRDDDFRQVPGDPNRMYAAFLENHGTVRAAWLSAYQGGRGIFDGTRLQEWSSENDRVVVREREFTPNRIAFTVIPGPGGRLVVGQGYDPGWRRNDGGAVEEFHHLVSVRVEPGQERIELHYFPDYFVVGAIVSIVSILLAVILPLGYRRLN